MKISIRKKTKSKKSPLAYTFFENAKGIMAVRSFIPTMKQFCLKSDDTVKVISPDKKLTMSLIYAFMINLILVISLHIFSTYIYKDSTFFLAEFNDFLGKIAHIFPLFKGFSLLLSPIIIIIAFLIKVSLYHLAVLPQKPKRGFKTTLKIAAYAESANLYLIFLVIYLCIARIPSAADGYFNDLAFWLFIIIGLLTFITSVKIIMKGCQRFHGLSEPEAIFVAFFPTIIVAIIPFIVLVVL